MVRKLLKFLKFYNFGKLLLWLSYCLQNARFIQYSLYKSIKDVCHPGIENCTQKESQKYQYQNWETLALSVDNRKLKHCANTVQKVIASNTRHRQQASSRASRGSPFPGTITITLIIIIPITPTAEVIININPDIQQSHQLNIKYTILMENIVVNCGPDAMGAGRAELTNWAL